MAAGRKVVGSAQLRQGDAMLQHGSVLLGGSQAMVSSVARGRIGDSLDAPLGDLLERPVPFEEAAWAVAAAAQEWSPEWERLNDAEEASRAAESHVARFRSPEWTWRR